MTLGQWGGGGTGRIQNGEKDKRTVDQKKKLKIFLSSSYILLCQLIDHKFKKYTEVTDLQNCHKTIYILKKKKKKKKKTLKIIYFMSWSTIRLNNLLCTGLMVGLNVRAKWFCLPSKKVLRQSF